MLKEKLPGVFTVDVINYRDSVFGSMVKVEIPPDADAMIVCRNEGYGLLPMRVLLQGQLRLEDVDELLGKYPGTRSITCIPIRSSEYIEVWRKER